LMPPHRFLVAVLLLGNAVAFAGVDPISRAVSALVVVILIAGTRRLPEVPTSHRWAGLGLAVLVAAQLTIWPQALRSLLQPGYVAVMKAGWAPLSLAPWSTVQAAASIVVAGGVALACARMATARSGLPVLLGVLTATCALLSVLGFAGEAGAPDLVLLVRENTGGGSVYGPFVNRNHFAQAIELSLPAAVVLMAAGVRRFGAGGAARQRSAVMILAGAVTISVGCAAMLRSGSRGGVLFLVLGALMTLPLWRRPAVGFAMCYACAGTADAALFMATFNMTFEFADLHRRSLYIAIAATCSRPVHLLSGAVGGALADRFGFQPVLVAAACCAAAVLVLVWRALPEPRHHHPAHLAGPAQAL